MLWLASRAADNARLSNGEQVANGLLAGLRIVSHRMLAIGGKPLSRVEERERRPSSSNREG